VNAHFQSAQLQTAAAPRAIALRTRGHRHGPITRLVSPSDIGALIKPFVFLDLIDAPAADAPGFGWHPHSGIATLTVLQEGSGTYEETTGARGTLDAGGVEWMRAGRGVWHTGSVVGTGRVKGFQLWIALPEDLENAASHSRYLTAAEVPAAGPARVILGVHEGVKSVIPAPAGINYLDVQLAVGETWTYLPPLGHDVAWLAVSAGKLHSAETLAVGELAVFEESNRAITIHAEQASRFVLGSAVKHPHDLVLGYYSVHTSQEALAAGEAEIRRIGNQLQSAGILA
jgi:redox-sensitive bicupin YhaK (pirin superfamily)